MAQPDGNDCAPRDIAAHIQHLAALTIHAVNSRDFILTSPGWNYMASDFTCNVLYDVNNTRGNETMLETDHYGIIDLKENLARFERLTNEFPAWQLKLVSQSTDVEEQKGKAEVFQVLEVVGLPVGIVTRTVLVVEFELRNSVWWCVGNRAVRGPSDG